MAHFFITAFKEGFNHYTDSNGTKLYLHAAPKKYPRPVVGSRASLLLPCHIDERCLKGLFTLIFYRLLLAPDATTTTGADCVDFVCVCVVGGNKHATTLFCFRRRLFEDGLRASIPDLSGHIADWSGFDADCLRTVCELHNSQYSHVFVPPPHKERHSRHRQS